MNKYIPLLWGPQVLPECAAAVCHKKEQCFMAKKGRLDFGLAEEGCLGKCPGGFVYGGGGGGVCK